jgi:hypothetical protein
LTSAYLLSKRSGYEIQIFEKADKIGVNAASTSVTVIKDEKPIEVGIDVPMRSIDAGTYTPLIVAESRILSSIIEIIKRIGCRCTTG